MNSLEATGRVLLEAHAIALAGGKNNSLLARQAALTLLELPLQCTCMYVCKGRIVKTHTNVIDFAVMSSRILRLYAEENAIDDTIYYLGEALRKGVIELDVFLKVIIKKDLHQLHVD